MEQKIPHRGDDRGKSTMEIHEIKTIRRAIQVLACGVCAIAVAPSAMAEAQRGFYLGISPGKSTYDIEKTEFDDIVIDAFNSQGAPVLTRSSTFEDSDTAVAVFAGYRFFPYLAVEASYLDLGTAEYRFTGTINPPRPVASTPATFNMDIESKGFTIAGLGGVPLGKVVDLHGRLGLIRQCLQSIQRFHCFSWCHRIRIQFA